MAAASAAGKQIFWRKQACLAFKVSYLLSNSTRHNICFEQFGDIHSALNYSTVRNCNIDTDRTISKPFLQFTEQNFAKNLFCVFS